MVKATHNSTPHFKISCPKKFSTICHMGPIGCPSISSSLFQSSILLFSIFSSCSPSSLIISNILWPLFYALFYLLQFLSNCSQYSLSNFLLSHLYNTFAIYLPGNCVSWFSLIFIFFVYLTPSPYCSSNSSINSCIFPKFSLGSQVSSFAI